MWFKVLCIFLLIIVFSTPSICFSQPDSKKWEFYGKDIEGSMYFYKKRTIRKSSKIIVRTYQTVTDDERKEEIERVKKYNIEESLKYQNYDHIVSLYEIDCRNKLVNIKQIIDCDNRGGILYSVKNKNSEWKSIIPGSTMESLYQKLCVNQKKPVKNKQ